MRAIPERLRGVFTTRRYTNPRLPLPLRPRLEVYMYLSVQMKDIDVAEDSGAVHRRVSQRAQLQSQVLRRHGRL